METYIWAWAPGLDGQERYRKVAEALHRSPDGWTVRERAAHNARSGASRRWLGLERGDGTLWFDGHILLAEGAVDDGVAVAVRAAPWLSSTPPRALGPVAGPTGEALDAFSVWTTAMVLLDRLADAVTTRPEATMAEVDRCAEWLRSPVRQHLMGRGVREQVLEPWRAYVTKVRRALLAVGEYRDGPVADALAGAPAPADSLLRPLTLLTTSRDEALILAEYEDRLERLEQETGRAAAEVGAVGTLATLALVPFEATLGLAFLLPVVLAGAAYYGGYALSRIGASKPEPPERVRSRTGGVVRAAARRILEAPAAVLVAPRIGAAEFAGAAHLWLRLLQLHRHDPATGSVAFGTDPALLHDRGGVALGGPLVQPREPLPARPACDLVGSRTYGDWRFQVDGRRLLGDDADETAALVTTAADRDDVLLAVGFRDTGAVLTARWLGRGLADPGRLPDGPWTLLRRDDGFEPFVHGVAP